MLPNDPLLKYRKSEVEPIIRNLGKPGFKFFCVSCKRERRQAPPARVGSPRFFFHVAISTAFFSLLSWPWMGVKGVFAFLIPVGLVMEIVYRLKMRAALVCPDCQFDPILYLSDQEKAVKRVEDAWRKKFEQKGIPFPQSSKPSPRRPRSLDLRE
jgi:hypothetical protein